MFTARSILSFMATSTATQCSAALPTMATTMTPMKNSLSPSFEAASEIEPTRISDITPTATPAIASSDDRLAHRPRLAVLRVVGLGVEEVAVGLQREPQARHVGEDQHARHGGRQALDRGVVVHALGARLRQPAPVDQLVDRGHDQRGGRQQQHRGLRRGGRAVEVLAVAPEPAEEHRGPEHEQHVAHDRADDRGLDHLVQPCAEREEGDDELRRVAEGDVEQAADPGPGAHRQLLGGAAHQRRGRDDPSAEAKKITTAPACASSRTIAIGMNGTSRYGQPWLVMRNRSFTKRLRLLADQVCAGECGR